MNKKLLSKICVSIIMIIILIIPSNIVIAKSNHNIQDLKSLKNIILGVKTESSTNNDYDLNNDGTLNILDYTKMSNEILNDNTIPKNIIEIPIEYYSESKEQGELIELYYNTWESFSYDEKTTPLTKRAIIYLPYGYNDNNQYNIFYYMHGGWSNETTTFGTHDNPNTFKNIVDNAIQNGDIKPMIIVCPTYNNTSENDSSNFSLSLELNKNFHNELQNDLIPIVETKYSTYAESTSIDDLKKSRKHRAFGGFSMGSVATWRTFEHCLDYFYYFMPMSCGTTLDDETIFKTASNFETNDYFIYIMTGTDDFAYSYENNRVEKMRNSSYFIEKSNQIDGNFIYNVKEGYSHDGKASTEYTYNGFMYFWNDNKNTSNDIIEFGTQTNRNFIVNNVLHSQNFGDIHFSSYIPKNYDASEPYGLFITLPGWEGLYFQGVGANLIESFPFEAIKYNDKMIVISTQLDDWGETSANMTIALTEYFINNYNINKVYLHGMSGGGETGSIVMGKRPDLYTAYLETSSKWNGDLETLAKFRTPVYLAIGEDDSYYGSSSLKETYTKLHTIYENQGLSNNEIDEILILDVYQQDYFTEHGYTDQHAGGQAFAFNEHIMSWLFSK